MARSTVYNQITTDEKIKNINPKNKELCSDFLDYLSSMNRSKSTLKVYENDLDIFFCWNLEFNNNKYFIDIKKRELVRFQGYALQEWGWGASRIKRVKSVISSLSNYIVDILQDDDDEFEDFKSIIGKIESPVNEPIREKTIIPDEEVDKFLDKLVSQGRYQQACVFALAAMSGSRKAELLRFKVEYFSDENVQIKGALYKTPKIKTKGRGVNGKQINKYVLYDFKKYFDLWMEERKRLGVESEWLFVGKSKDGKYEQMKVSTLDSWAIIFSKELGIDFYWHAMRHYLTTKMKKYNIPDHVIKEYFQWNSVEMVGVYSDIDASDDFSKYFGSDGMISGKTGSISDM